MAPAIPLNDTVGYWLLSIIVMVAIVHSAVATTQKQVGRFLQLFRLTIASNLCWQIASIIFLLIPDEFVPRTIGGSLNFSTANLFAICSVFLNIRILEAFNVLTGLSETVTNGYRLAIILLVVLNAFCYFSGTYFGLQMARPFIYPMFMFVAAYVTLFNNIKTIYLIRLVYLDRIDSRKAIAQTETKLVKEIYSRLNLTFILIFALNLTTVVIWGIGHVLSNSSCIKIGETISGVELPFYPKLIGGIRDMMEVRARKKVRS